jgi:predicted RNA-binding protein
MVNYWLCVTNPENWTIIREKKVWGVTERYKDKIKRVKPGDFLIFYVKPKKIAGIFKAVTESFKDEEEIFIGTEFWEGKIFPYRIKLQPYTILKAPVAFEKLIPRLTFIKNKRVWGVYFRKQMQSISSMDFKRILSFVERAQRMMPR